MPASDPNAPLLHPAPARRDRAPGRLRAFSDALARRLPGSWSAVTEDYFAYSPAHADVMDRLWDNGHAEWALNDFVHHEAALLDSPGNENFVVLARPLHSGQFLVAALAPPGVDGTLRTDHVPHGIAVPSDPARAAADIERRLLPRYRQAVEAVRAPAMREAYVRALDALDDWNAVSDSFCDEQGFPLDEDAYGIRQAQRDAEAWLPFETFLFHGPAAIEQAKTNLAALTPPPGHAKRWSQDLRALTGALAEGIRIRDEWESRLVTVLDHRDDPDRWLAFKEAIDARNADGWSAVIAFMDHGPVLHAIEEAARLRASAGTARVAAARARSTSTVPAPRPGSRLPAPEAPPPPPGPPARSPTPGR
jgi:hypothetical protein